jgi:hypothetical protein
VKADALGLVRATVSINHTGAKKIIVSSYYCRC